MRVSKEKRCRKNVTDEKMKDRKQPEHKHRMWNSSLGWGAPDGSTQLDVNSQKLAATESWKHCRPQWWAGTLFCRCQGGIKELLE